MQAQKCSWEAHEKVNNFKQQRKICILLDQIIISVPIFATMHFIRYHTDPETGVIIPQHLRERVVEYAADHTMEQVQKHICIYVVDLIAVTIAHFLFET